MKNHPMKSHPKKKMFLTAAAAALLLPALASCAGTQSDLVGPGRPVSVFMDDDVTEVKITHGSMGQFTEWTIEGDEIAPLQTWANGLEYELSEWEEGHTPGDADGGETYDFALTGGAYPGFVYLIAGPDACYLLIEGDWYTVSNPSDPPVHAPDGNN